MAIRIWRTASTDLEVGGSIYAQGDALGVKKGITVPDSGIVRGITITDVDDEASVTANVWFFDSEPTGIAANAAFSLGDSDLRKVTAVHLVDSDFDGINGIAKFEECNIPYVANQGKLWLQCELEGAATPTFSLGAVEIVLHIEW